MNMAKAILKLEFYAGHDINGAFTEAIRIAKKLDCYTEFSFNGVTCLAHPEGLAEDGVLMYHNQVKSGSKYPIAVT